jgi:hypothetical protein
MNAVDTNVLIYSLAMSDPDKQARASALPVWLEARLRPSRPGRLEVSR